jgi:hypothetical protein
VVVNRLLLHDGILLLMWYNLGLGYASLQAAWLEEDRTSGVKDLGFTPLRGLSLVEAKDRGDSSPIVAGNSGYYKTLQDKDLPCCDN